MRKYAGYPLLTDDLVDSDLGNSMISADLIACWSHPIVTLSIIYFNYVSATMPISSNQLERK